MTAPLGLAARTGFRVNEARFEDLSASTKLATKAHLLDCLGMMVLGSVSSKRRSGLDDDSYAPNAAFHLSLMCSASGLDDFDEETRAHPGGVLVPALVAASKPEWLSRQPISGQDFLTSLAVGYDFMRLLGQAMGAPRLHSQGLHPSSILGTPAAALAVGRMFRLQPGQLANCIGIGASLASGITEFDDADEARAVQSAWAAKAGLSATLLAFQGYQSSPAALESPVGLIGRTSTASPSSRMDLLTPDFDTVESVSFKPYSHFSDLHPATSALFELITSNEIDLAQIETVTVQVPEHVAVRLHMGFPPATTREAKRSAEFVMAAVAIAAASGASCGDLAGSFSEAGIHDDAILRLGHRVVLLNGLEAHGSSTAAVVEVRLRDGTSLLESATGYPGDGRQEQLRWDWDDALARFKTFVGPILGSSSAESTASFVMGMDSARDIRSHMAIFCKQLMS